MSSISQGWPHQRTAEAYLRKLMVEHFGLGVNDPAEIDSLWKEGYTPPLCEWEARDAMQTTRILWNGPIVDGKLTVGSGQQPAQGPTWKEHIEYRLKWTYPNLANRGQYTYGPPQDSYEHAWQGWGIRDDGWTWAGEPLAVEARTVRTSEWQLVTDPQN